MGKPSYSMELCRELMQAAGDASLAVRRRPARYEAGDRLDLSFVTAWPEVEGRGRFRIEKFAGGGYAGQVYRCVVEQLDVPASPPDWPLRVGFVCAVKILVPPTASKRRFRDAIYWLGFQAPFSPQVNLAACRTGLLWAKLVRHALGIETGVADAAADVYASFYDERLGAYGEIREWVEGRTWRLEGDTRPRARRRWQTVSLSETDSPEYVAKRRFMDGLVRLLHRLGAAELARQYEWGTMKSQPNVLKRMGHDADPAGGLCAVDFRAGLALLPWLPMSPGDVRLILRGLRRGSLVQFDRADFAKLRAYAASAGARNAEIGALAVALEAYDRAYRRSMPDLAHQGWRLLTDGSLRTDVRKGLADGYHRAGVIDAEFAAALPLRPLRFAAFQGLLLIPFAGGRLRRFWGDRAVRRHVSKLLTSGEYLRRAVRAQAAGTLIQWHRAGRTGERRTRFLAQHPAAFWVQRGTLGLLPAGLHRFLAEPGYVWSRLAAGMRFAAAFFRDAAFREKWLADLARQGYEEGILHADEWKLIHAQTRDPFIAEYLKCLAVHFATLPVTQIVSVSVGTWVLVRTLLAGGSWELAGARFLGILLLFQAIPVSPGSLCRGAYAVYRMIRNRNFRDYMVAAPFSFLKYLGYFAFPIQMVTAYPVLARFMASYWATGMVHAVPVFGEKGALLEHQVFDLFFNVPRAFGLWARARMRGLLDLWLLLGLGALGAYAWAGRLDPTTRGGVNALLTVLAVFVLPRILFYPVLHGRARKPRPPASPGPRGNSAGV